MHVINEQTVEASNWMPIAQSMCVQDASPYMIPEPMPSQANPQVPGESIYSHGTPLTVNSLQTAFHIRPWNPVYSEFTANCVPYTAMEPRFQ